MGNSGKKKLSKEKDSNNSTVYNRILRYSLRCSICPPNQGENSKRHAKHGVTKPKNKDKRK